MDYNYKDVAERLAGFLSKIDIDEVICKNVNCKEHYDCADCLIDYFSKKCKYECDAVCVNDRSEHCADFVDNFKCGCCKFREIA